MPRGHWGAGFAIAVIVLSVGVIGVLVGRAENYAFIEAVCLDTQDDADKKEAKKPNENDAERDADIVSSLPPLSNEHHSRCDAYKEYYRDQHRVGRFFNDADDAVAWGTWAAAVLAGVAVYLLWGTLVATRETERLAGETLGEAEKTTTAANATTKATQQTGIAQTQAYLSVKSINLGLVEYEKPLDEKPDLRAFAPYFELILRNTGNSPSSDVKITYNYQGWRRVYERSSDGARYEKFFEDTNEVNFASISAQSEIRGFIYGARWTPDEIKILDQASFKVVISGMISWNNATHFDSGEDFIVTNQFFRFKLQSTAFRTDFFKFDKEKQRYDIYPSELIEMIAVSETDDEL